MSRLHRLESTTRYDCDLRASGVVEIVIRHVWTAAEVQAFFALLAPLYDEARRLHGSARILTIVEAVQSPGVAMHVRSQALALSRPGDKRAFVVATFLSKLQIRRLSVTDAFGLFTDRTTAERWLLEPSKP